MSVQSPEMGPPPPPSEASVAPLLGSRGGGSGDPIQMTGHWTDTLVLYIEIPLRHKTSRLRFGTSRTSCEQKKTSCEQ
jgi:hypothetical protein